MKKRQEFLCTFCEAISASSKVSDPWESREVDRKTVFGMQALLIIGFLAFMFHNRPVKAGSFSFCFSATDQPDVLRVPEDYERISAIDIAKNGG